MPQPDRPTIVTLCGSTRFGEHFAAANLRETLAGKIVLSIGCNMRSDTDIFGQLSEQERVRVKAALDRLHLRKIDLSDEILVLDVPQRTCPKCGTPWRHDVIRVEKCGCGTDIGTVPPVPYIGESTRNEIAHAVATGKRVRYLSQEGVAS